MMYHSGCAVLHVCVLHVCVVQEGESMARWMSCLLQPAHRDVPAQQHLEFAGLNGLTTSQLSALRAKLFHTDEDSLF